MAKSLSYRKNLDAIVSGDFPKRFVEVGDLVEGESVLDVGGAEGSLALYLASKGKTVTVLEKSPERVQAGMLLRQQVVGPDTRGTVSFILGDAIDVVPRLEKRFDSIVFMRSLYYFRDDAVKLLSLARGFASQLILVANGNRERDFLSDPNYQHGGLGKFNFWSTLEGMDAAARMAGFTVANKVLQDDPILVARSPSRKAS